MNPRYRETARRHRVLFVLIILLCALFGLSTAAGSPKLYRSDATLSFPSLDASNGIVTPPAAQSQEMLTELLATRSFPQFVAARSSLGAYLKHHATTGSGPIAMLKQLMRGSPTYDERITTALGPKRVTSMPSGPELLSVSFEAPSPALAKSTLDVLIDHFLRERAGLQDAARRAALDQLNTAQVQFNEAQRTLNNYTRNHPASTTNGDIGESALANAVRQAAAQVKAAASQVATATVGSGTGVTTAAGIVDHPNLPIGPTTGKKRVGELTIVGAFVGALISFGLIVLMSRNRDEPLPATGPIELHDRSPNGTAGAPEHEPPREVRAGEAGSGERIRRE